MYTSLKTKLKLTDTQTVLMAKHAGIARFTFNWKLATWRSLYCEALNPNALTLEKYFNNRVKPVYPGMKEQGICQKVTQSAFEHLGKTFGNFFSGKTGDPKFQKQGQHDSFTIDASGKPIAAPAYKKNPVHFFQLFGIVNPSFFSSPSHKQQTSGGSGFALRVAAPKDLMQLADILALSFHGRDGFVNWVYPLLRLGIYEDLKNRLRCRSEHYICLVAETVSGDLGVPEHCTSPGECVAGTVEMALRSRLAWQVPSSDYPYLSNLAVHPQYRRLGIARQLLCSCEQAALQWGFSEIYLHVLENNHAARQLYDRAGYRLQQVDGHWSAWLLGQPRRLFLRKQLIS